MTAGFPTLRGRRGFAVGFLAALAATVGFVHAADARHYPHHASSGAHVESSGPPYAAIVVDANSGAVLHAANPDELRHPASLTKIMTLYLLFERLEAGKLRLDTPLEISEHAAAQSPTKLGLKPGQTITVEDAIGGLVTRSANDAAVVVAEAIGGSEHDFADMMTRKAHALGMSRTLYRNASGLPNDEQVTTARDQALLGRLIQERFPRYYRYFSMKTFAYHGAEIGNHNHLLGRVEGVDGIKTGYTQASGFNLVTSVRRNNRHIVAVVLGGASAASRDARMKTLIEEYIVAASAQKSVVAIAEAPAGAVGVGATAHDTRSAEPRTVDTLAAEHTTEPVLDRIAHAFEGYVAEPQTPPVKEAYDARDNRAADHRPQTRPEPVYTVASTSSRPWPAPPAVAPVAVAPPTVPGDRNATKPNHANDPIRPIQVKTVKVKLAANEIAAVAPGSAQSAGDHQSPTEMATPNRVVAPAPRPSTTGAIIGTSHSPAERVAAAWEPVREIPSDPQNRLALTQHAVNVASATMAHGASSPKATDAATAVHVSATEHAGWVIQVGAFDDEREAREKLSAVKAKASHMLGHADPFTEPVVKGDKTFYRARFAGLQKDEAEAICRQLKRNDIACMTIKN